MGELFDVYLAVDWSARNTASPKRASSDAIWIAEQPRANAASGMIVSRDRGRLDTQIHCLAQYFRTRAHAFEYLHARLVTHGNNRCRTLIGFDFPLGFPTGFDEALGFDQSPCEPGAAWRSVWHALSQRIMDDEANRNNRFEVAAEFNRQCTDGLCGPFWGHPRGRSYANLEPRSPSSGYPVLTRGGVSLERLRSAEKRESRNGIQSIWKLYGPASVGSQALLGIPRVHALRASPALERSTRVWPFETGFSIDCLPGEAVFAEIWPNLFPHDTTDPIRDRAQVTAVVRHLAALDRHHALTPLFSPPAGLTPREHDRCITEEGWIAGAGLREYISARLR
ncbi:MAG: hypothetical protein ACOCRN_05805 [Spirochaetia bacterium]